MVPWRLWGMYDLLQRAHARLTCRSADFLIGFFCSGDGLPQFQSRNLPKRGTDATPRKGENWLRFSWMMNSDLSLVSGQSCFGPHGSRRRTQSPWALEGDASRAWKQVQDALLQAPRVGVPYACNSAIGGE